ncbi:MAG: patatin-like phospholipase family protein [Geminicoccaceae bacterium]
MKVKQFEDSQGLPEKMPEYVDKDDGNLILNKELNYLRRHEKYQVESNKLIGLALSGGGVRSAAFSLGALQALAVSGKLAWFHYMSTVSGGGFIGSSLTWFLSQGKLCHSMDRRFGVDEDNFPLGKKGAAALHLASENKPGSSEEEARNRARVEILDHIRQHGNYLNTGGGLNLLAIIAMLLKSMIPPLLIYFFLIILPLAWIIYPFAPPHLDYPIPPTVPLLPAWFPSNSVWLAAFSLLGILVLMTLFYSLKTYVPGKKSDNQYESRKAHELDGQYESRYRAQLIGGITLASVIGLFLLSLLPIAYESSAAFFSAGFTIAGITVTLGRLAIQMHSISLARSKIGDSLIVLACGLLLFGLLMLGYAFCHLIANRSAPHLPWWPIPLYAFGRWLETTMIIALSMIFFWCVAVRANINFVGMHRLYRDRLMETFLPELPPRYHENDGVDIADDDEKKVSWTSRRRHWKPAFSSNKAFLHHMCGLNRMCGIEDESRKPIGPYHIINTNIVLVGSKESRYRGRGGTNFILSPLYCGSDATGWRRTDEWKMHDGCITLPTAMAISGAAINPRTGPDGRGPMRSGLVSLFMSLTNARLGFWARNPKYTSEPDDSSEQAIGGEPPNFLLPGLQQGVREQGYHEGKAFIELTDGAHFDNTGLYELIRRRTKLIVMIDGTADKALNYQSLATAFERIRVDFGVQIRFNPKDYNLEQLLPEANDPRPFQQKYNLAVRGFAIARIDYQPVGEYRGTEDGVLIFIKSTMIEDLPADVLGYKSANPDFPSESTTDQFFDEIQLEAYRELGYRVTKQALNDDEVQEEFNKVKPITKPEEKADPVAAE